MQAVNKKIMPELEGECSNQILTQLSWYDIKPSHFKSGDPLWRPWAFRCRHLNILSILLCHENESAKKIVYIIPKRKCVRSLDINLKERASKSKILCHSIWSIKLHPKYSTFLLFSCGQFIIPHIIHHKYSIINSKNTVDVIY